MLRKKLERAPRTKPCEIHVHSETVCMRYSQRQEANELTYGFTKFFS